jgi:hypothetical protein
MACSLSFKKRARILCGHNLAGVKPQKEAASGDSGGRYLWERFLLTQPLIHCKVAGSSRDHARTLA